VRRIRRIYLTLYRLIWGHLPPGTLVRYKAAPFDEYNIRKIGLSPPFEAVGVVIGGWQYWKHPGYVQHGSVVVIGEGRHDLENRDLTVLQ